MNIKDLIGETTAYDKKVALEERKPKSWCKSVSAFANGYGGCLFFGIDDNDYLVGLANPKETAEKLSEIIKERLEPIPRFDISFQEEDGKVILIVEIYEGKQSPYYYVDSGSRTAYQRVGNESVPADSIALLNMVLKGNNLTYDELVTDKDKDKYSFSKLKATYYQKTGKVFEESDFESWGLVENGKLTNAGLLLADEAAVRHSRLFCTRWNGLDKASGVMDALDDKEFAGSLIYLLQNGLEFVVANSKKQWKKTGDTRIELPEYPERSVLEGLVNALIHRDYTELGSEVHIDIFDDRLEIYSPGGMYEGSFIQERNILSIPSRRRNPVLADAFNRLRYMERRGSGFKKICADYLSQFNYNDDLQPKFYSDHGMFVLTLKNLNYVVTKNVTKNVTQNVTKNVCLTSEELRLIEYIKDNPQITVAVLAEIEGKNRRTILRVIEGLKVKGKLERQGRKGGKWIVLEE